MVILAFSGKRTADFCASMLAGRGIPVYAVCHSLAETLRRCGEVERATVLCGYRFADGVAERLHHDLPRGFPLILLVTPAESGMVVNPALYTLTYPVRADDLLEAMDSTTDHYVHWAKKALIREFDIGEPEAHRLLQKRSMGGGLPIGDIAQNICKEFFP